MIPVDLHTHSLFSGCGVHTVLELLAEAKRLGMAGLAVTDHGKLVGGRANSVFFERLHDPVPGVRLLKGVEANVNGDSGQTDVNPNFLGFMDVVLLGLHDNLPAGMTRDYYTAVLLKAMEGNPFVDIITHPNSPSFPVHYSRLAETAVRLDMVIEMNNAKVALKRTPDREVEELIEACKYCDCRVAVNSDAHCLRELACDADIRSLLSKHRYPEELIVNRTADTAFAFIEERRPRKKIS